MRCATPSTPAADLESNVLEAAGVTTDALGALGRAARGTRRALTMPLSDVEVRDETSEAGPAVGIEFALPAGSFATTVCSELQLPPLRAELTG
jgi:tRNA(Glu) U13 pseudouridine synthase TruD